GAGVVLAIDSKLMGIHPAANGTLEIAAYVVSDQKRRKMAHICHWGKYVVGKIGPRGGSRLASHGKHFRIVFPEAFDLDLILSSPQTSQASSLTCPNPPKLKR